MRKLIVIGLALGAAACARPEVASRQPGPLTIAYEEYMACLRQNPPEACSGARAKFETTKAYVDSATNAVTAQRQAAPPRPLVLSTYQPPPVQQPRQPITCTTYFNMTTCQ